jgi:hypothetical protein
MFTSARRLRRTAVVQLNESAHGRKDKGSTVVTLPSWVSQGPANLEMVAPLKARACEALYAALGSKRRPASAGPRIMSRGVERC